MPEHGAFLNAILERPDDDLPRLVYADYLDETGFAERAEFIRVQIELARSDPTDDRFADLTRREAELLRDGVGGIVPGVRGKQTFRRGFVEFLHTTADRLIAAPQSILLLAPIRELRISNADNAIDELARVPGLDRIETLDLRNNSFGTRDRLFRFFDAAPLRSLTNLRMRNNQLWSDDVEKLAASRWSAQLRTLDLSGNAIADAGASVLAGAENLRGLHSLILRSDELDWRDRIQSAGATALGQSRTLNALRILDLAGHLIGEVGLPALILPGRLPCLECIDVSSNRIRLNYDGDGDSFFAAAPRLRMRIWDLSISTIGRRTAEQFATWPQLETLEELILEQCEWEPGARELLSESPWAYKIRLGNPASGELA